MGLHYVIKQLCVPIRFLFMSPMRNMNTCKANLIDTNIRDPQGNKALNKANTRDPPPTHTHNKKTLFRFDFFSLHMFSLPPFRDMEWERGGAIKNKKNGCGHLSSPLRKNNKNACGHYSCSFFLIQILSLQLGRAVAISPSPEEE